MVQLLETGVTPACAKDLKSAGKLTLRVRLKSFGWLAKDTATLIDVLKEARSASEAMLGQLPSSVLKIRTCKR